MARSKFEIIAQKELEDEDWFVDFKIRPTRVMRNALVDYWHLFDLLAWKPGKLRFISIKGKSYPKQHRLDLEEFITPEGVSVELWSYRKIKNKFEPKKMLI